MFGATMCEGNDRSPYGKAKIQWIGRKLWIRSITFWLKSHIFILSTIEISAAGTLNLILYTICCVFVVFHTYIFHSYILVKVDIFVVKVDISWYRCLRFVKLMSDSCSATPKTPRNVFLRKKIFTQKKYFWDPNS